MTFSPKTEAFLAELEVLLAQAMLVDAPADFSKEKLDLAVKKAVKWIKTPSIIELLNKSRYELYEIGALGEKYVVPVTITCPGYGCGRICYRTDDVIPWFVCSGCQKGWGYTHPPREFTLGN